MFFPTGTYIVSPDGTGPWNFCIRLEHGVRFVGAGMDDSIIKLASTNGACYAGIVGPIEEKTDLTGLQVTDLTIDMNGAGNPVTSKGDAPCTGYKPRGVAAWNGRGITIQRVRFRDGQCTWYLQLAATSPTARTEDATVDSCRFENAGRPAGSIPPPPGADWDHTSLHMDGVRGRVTNNTFTFTTTNIYGARAAFELHGGPHHAEHNTITGYLHGVHIVGSVPAGPGIATVLNNTVHHVHTAFTLWPALAAGHTYGVRDTTIADNDIILVNDRNIAHALPCSAVTTAGGDMGDAGLSGQPFANITITGNTIYLDPTNPIYDPTTQRSSTFSFIRNDELTPDTPDRNLIIDSNTVHGSVAGGIRITGRGSSVHGLRITGNIFTDLGTHWHDDPTRNSAVFISKLRTVDTVEISRNAVRYPTSKEPLTFALIGGTVGATWNESVRHVRHVRVIDNSVTRTDDTRPIVRHVHLGIVKAGQDPTEDPQHDQDGTVQDLHIHGNVDGWNAPSGTLTTPLFTARSTLTDQRDGNVYGYTINDEHGEWARLDLVLLDPVHGQTFPPDQMTTFTGTGFPGATITLTPQEPATPATTTIDPTGHWTATKWLGNGPYTFTVDMTISATLLDRAPLHITPTPD